MRCVYIAGMWIYLYPMQGSMRLAADPKEESNVTKSSSALSGEPNTGFNVSMIEYEIVQLPA